MKIFDYFLLFVAVLVMSCSSDVNIDFPNFPPNGTNCLPGQGAIISQTRTLGDFNSIVNSAYANILITQGPKEDIIIEAQQNILQELKTEVANDELRITLNRCVNIAQAVKVHITIPEIRNLTLTGVGDFIAQNDFDLDEFIVVLTGVGDFRLKGTASELDIILTGVGNIKAFELPTDICEVTLTGVGDVEVFVNNDLKVTLSGVGKVYYKGDPTITSTITGSGSIVDAN